MKKQNGSSERNVDSGSDSTEDLDSVSFAFILFVNIFFIYAFVIIFVVMVSS